MLEGPILITGGAGYLGRGILRRAAEERWPANFTVFSRDEEKQWRLKHRYPHVRCVLGSVEDEHALATVMAGHQTVIHAAAVKFVPEAEFNVVQAFSANAVGTLNVARAAARYDVERAVLVSTDKACLPVNLYGATKMVAEKIWSEANGWGDCLFTTARYGNVIGSTGSIVPLFRRQLETAGQVMVTDPAMTRFWMTVDQAVDVIIAAMLEPMAGAVVADPCAAMSIGGLAETIVLESGLCCGAGGGEHSKVCDPASKIVVVGPRPGEKKHEMLVHDYEAPRTAIANGRFVISPSTRTAVMPSLAQAYTSDAPFSWMTPEAMTQAIADSRDV